MTPGASDPDAVDDAGRGSHRAAFVGLFVATGAAMLGIGIILPILPLYAQYLGASSLMIGIIFAAFAVSRGAFAPIVGRVSDRHGRKRLLLLGLGFYVVLSVAYALASRPGTLAGIRFLQGFASVMVTPVAQSYVGDITPEGREGEMMNLFYIALFAGVAVGPVLGGYLSEVRSITAPFYAMAAAAMLALVLVVVAVPESPAAVGPGDGLGFRESLSAVFGDTQMRGLIAYIATRGFYRWGFNSFFPVFAVSVAALDRTQVGLVLTGYMAAGGLLQYPLGRLADSHARHRTSFVVLGGTLSALSMLAVPWARSLLALLALTLAMGVFSAVSRASAVAIRTERGRVHGMGAVTGAFTASLSAGQVFGPIGFGLVVDLLDVRSAFYLGGVVGLLGTAGAYWYLRRGPDEPPDRAGSGVGGG